MSGGPDPWQRPLRVVALGGGHGLGAMLRALRRCSALVPLGLEVTAVVTVADNGGSSGRLRREFALPPPGDLRMALASLIDDVPADPVGSDHPRGGAGGGAPGWAALLQHRFASAGPLDGHALGNLVLVAAWELTGDPVEALDLVGRLVGARGRVLPMCAVPLDIAAEVEPGDTGRAGGDAPRRQVPGGGVGAGTRTVRGQAEVAVARGHIRRVWLEPGDPPACPAAVAAIHAADWVVLGPGSWFTSVLPHLLVPGLRDAVTDGPARVLLALNLDPAADETAGYPPAEHLQLLRDHAPGLAPDVVLADPLTAGGPDSAGRAALATAVARTGGSLVVAELAERDPRTGVASARHDTDRLARALAVTLTTPTTPPTPAPPTRGRSRPTDGTSTDVQSAQGIPGTAGVAGSPACP